MEELISVIIPVYNVEKYLEQCVRSVIGQTYKNLEIILVEDCSTDESKKICDMLKKIDNRIIVIENDKNRGLSYARNAGIKTAKGKYISFIDSDDYVSKYFIERLYNLCKSNNCDISQCSYEIFNNDILPTQKDKSNEDVKFDENVKSGKEVIYNMYKGKDAVAVVNSIIMCNKLYSKKIFDNIQFPVGHINEDEAVIYKIYYYTDRVAITKDSLYYYRKDVNNDSITSAKFSLKNLYYINILEQRDEFFKEHKEEELVAYNKKTYYYTLITRYIKCKEYIENSFDIQNEIKEKYKKVFKEMIKSNKYSAKEKVLMMFARMFPKIYTKKIG